MLCTLPPPKENLQKELTDKDNVDGVDGVC